MTRALTPMLALLVALPALAQEIDPKTFVNAPSRLLLSPDAKVGYWAERVVTAGEQTFVERTAIVGETADAWLVESSSPAVTALVPSFPALEGSLFALTVRKADGEVTQAGLAKPGQTPVDVAIAPAAGPLPPAEPEGAPERVKLALGEFDAKRVEANQVVSWVGTAGDTKDVLLKVAGGPEGFEGFELAALPTTEQRQLSGASIETRLVTYTNGMTLWMTSHPVVCALMGDGKGKHAVLRMVTGETSLEVRGAGTDAKRQLTWPEQ